MAGGRSGTNSYMKDGRKDGRVTDQEKGAAEQRLRRGARRKWAEDNVGRPEYIFG